MQSVQETYPKELKKDDVGTGFMKPLLMSEQKLKENRC